MIIQCPKCQSRYDSNEQNTDDPIQCRCGAEIQVPDLSKLARSWKCPNCSGNVNPSQARCDYCDAYIAFARCPACFSIAPYDEAKFCGECGETLTLPIKPVLKDKEKMPCPRCDSHLKSKVINSHLIDYCHDCSGVWLSHQLLDKLLKQLPINSQAVLGIKHSIKNKNFPRQEIQYLRCPACDKTMNRHNFMSDSFIIVDQCSKHGIWFDKHELAVALEYARSRKNGGDTSSYEDKNTSRRDKTEIFEVKDEDLSLLLEEFPHWVVSSS